MWFWFHHLKEFREVSAENCGKLGVYKLGIGRKGQGQQLGGLKRERPRREPGWGQLSLFSPLLGLGAGGTADSEGNPK